MELVAFCLGFIYIFSWYYREKKWPNSSDEVIVWFYRHGKWHVTGELKNKINAQNISKCNALCQLGLDYTDCISYQE